MATRLMQLQRNDTEGAMACYRDAVFGVSGCTPYRPDLWRTLLMLQNDPDLLIAMRERAEGLDLEFARRAAELSASA